jgi:hypothetical protein
MDAFLELHPGQLYLLVAPHPYGARLMNALAARLALSGPVRVLDGGNHFDVLAIARHIRCQIPHLDAVLKHIAIARAFTCYQMVTLLVQQRMDATPVLILDLLTTFCDESATPSERLRLLDQSLERLHCLSRQAPTIVSATPLPAAGQPGELLTRLENAASHICHFEIPAAVAQPRLL